MPPVKKPAAKKPAAKAASNGGGGETAAASKQSHPYYCPGCGRRWNFPTECVGQTPAAPHTPIEVISTRELDGDPKDFTPAPDTGT